MKKQWLIILVIWAAGVRQTNAQLNEADSMAFQLRVGLTGVYQQGNVAVTNVKTKLDVVVNPQNIWVLKSQNSSLYQAFGNGKVDNDIFSRNYIYYRPARVVYPFGMMYISTNYRRKINTRLFASAGMSWPAIRTTNHVVKLSVSTVYERTRFAGSQFNFTRYNGATEIALWRPTVFVAGWHNLLQRHIRLCYDAYWQPAYQQNTNYRTQLDLTLDFPVWKGLSFNMLYAFTHENVVIDKVKQYDAILTFGLAFQKSLHKKR